MSDLLLSSDLLRRLEQFELLARRRSKSSAKGERQSRARGHSVEFADHRHYVPGDDFRYVDWNLYARLDRLFLKLYEEERELPVRIFLDASESMSFGQPPKFDFARQVAAAVGYVALCAFDRVSVVAFPEHAGDGLVLGALRGVRGRKSARRFFSSLSQLRASGEAHLNEVLRRGALEARQVGLAVVLSDFLDPAGYATGLNALAGRGFHVDLVQILAPEEWTPPTSGDLRLVDAETGAVQEVTFGRFRLAAYQRTVRGFCERLREYARGRGMACFSVSSDMVLEELLLRRLREAEVWG